MRSLKNTLFASAFVVLSAASAQAGTFSVDVYTGDIGSAFNAFTSSASLFTAGNNSQHATFTYTGDLNFVNTAAQNNTPAGDKNASFFGANSAGISSYTAVGSTFSADYGNFASLASFLSASGSVTGYGYGSLYVITDTTPASGVNLVISHDDGAGVYVNGVLQPGTTTGPTTVKTETVVNLPTGPAFTIAYGRENGTPSVLTVAVPEPMTLSLLGAGLMGLGLARRRRT